MNSISEEILQLQLRINKLEKEKFRIEELEKEKNLIKYNFSNKILEIKYYCIIDYDCGMLYKKVKYINDNDLINEIYNEISSKVSNSGIFVKYNESEIIEIIKNDTNDNIINIISIKIKDDEPWFSLY